MHSIITATCKNLIPFVAGIGINLLITFPISAAIVVVEDETAQIQSTKIELSPGKATAISFDNGEIINSVLLSDQSRHVYTISPPLDSGRAKTIFLRQIQNIEIPGTTTTSNPNLMAITIDADGNQNVYEFTIHNSTQQHDNNKLSIRPTIPEPVVETPPDNIIVTSLGEATPEDIQLGLDTQLRKGKFPLDDPLVFAVLECVSLAMNQTSLIEAAKLLNVPLSVLQELGKIGLQVDARRRIMPLEKLDKN